MCKGKSNHMKDTAIMYIHVHVYDSNTQIKYNPYISHKHPFYIQHVCPICNPT